MLSWNSQSVFLIFFFLSFFFPVGDKVNCQRPSNGSRVAAIIFVCRPTSAFIIWQYLQGKEWDLYGTLSRKEIWHLISSHLFKPTTTQKIDFSVQLQFRLSLLQWFGGWQRKKKKKKNDLTSSYISFLHFPKLNDFTKRNPREKQNTQHAVFKCVTFIDCIKKGCLRLNVTNASLI